MKLCDKERRAAGNIPRLPPGRVIIMAGIACLATSLHEARADGLECPEMADLKTLPLAAAIASVVPSGAQLAEPSVAASAITVLREHGLSPSNTINHLIALYCPSVASDATLSHQAKVARVRQFASQATKLVLATNGVDDIIFNVPIDPAVTAISIAKAEKDGLTIEQWIAQKVAAAAAAE